MKKKIIIIIVLVMSFVACFKIVQIVSVLKNAVYTEVNFRKLDSIYYAIKHYREDNSDEYPENLNCLVELGYLNENSTKYVYEKGEESFIYMIPSDSDEKVLVLSPIPVLDGENSHYLYLDIEGYKGLLQAEGTD